MSLIETPGKVLKMSKFNHPFFNGYIETLLTDNGLPLSACIDDHSLERVKRDCLVTLAPVQLQIRAAFQAFGYTQKQYGREFYLISHGKKPELPMQCDQITAWFMGSPKTVQIGEDGKIYLD